MDCIANVMKIFQTALARRKKVVIFFLWQLSNP